MRRAQPHELGSRALPVLTASMSEAELLSWMPVTFAEITDPLATPEPSKGALIQLNSGEYVVVYYGQDSHQLTLEIPENTPDASGLLARFFAEVPLPASRILWHRSDIDPRGHQRQMRYRKLHGTDLEVSELGLGTWTITTGWWGTYTDAEAERIVRAAIARGINYIDTADAYGNGRGETVLAPVLRDHPELVVGTKFGYDFYNNPERPRGQRELPQDMTPGFIRFACEQSLKRLGTDHVAIYQPHNPRVATLLGDEHWETLEQLKAEGKILTYGPSLGPAIGWRDEGIYATAVRKAPVTQMIYNVLEQDPGREFILAAETAQRGRRYGGVDEAVRGENNKRLCEPSDAFDPSFRAWKTPALAEGGPQFLIRVTHSSGLLEGKYTLETKFDESDHRSHRPRAWLVEGLQKVERLKPFYEARGVTIGQFALLWLYAHPSILSALPNIYEEAQIEEFAAASEHEPLSDEEMEAIHALYERGFDVVPYVEEEAAAAQG